MSIISYWFCAVCEWELGGFRETEPTGCSSVGVLRAIMAGWAHWLPVLLLGTLLFPEASPKKDEQIQDVTAKQLQELTEESDYVAVYWCE